MSTQDGGPPAPKPPSLGVLPYQHIKAMVAERQIAALTTSPNILPEQVQPASFDLRVGSVAYRIRASFLPGRNSTVFEKIKQVNGYQIDISNGFMLEKGHVYVIPLMERLNLSGHMTGFANPKSSTGRLDVLTRLITDGGEAFDQVAARYEGPLYVEVAPRTFSIVVKPGVRLNQLRFRRGSPNVATSEIQSLLQREGQSIKEKMVGVTIDLQGASPGSLVGYRAKKHTDFIDINLLRHYEAEDFWEPIPRPRDRTIILNPGDFYILVTQEAVEVPPDYAAEMVAYDTTVGEFRVHYAGFFDPGFGWEIAGGGSKAVLEVRSHEVPFMLEHGQTVGWLRYERMAARPDRLYGAAIGSSYQHQGLALAKQFRVGK